MVLVLLSLVCAGVVWFAFLGPGVLRQRASPSPARSPLEGRSLLDARRIELSAHASAQPYVLSRHGPGRFLIDSPIRDLASPAILADIARAWESAELRAPQPVARIELKQMGLDQAALFLEAAFESGPVRVELGNPTAAGAATIWVRRGDTVFVGPMALLTCLQFEQEKVRSPAVFTQPLDAITEVAVERRDAAGMTETAHATREGADWVWRTPSATIAAAADFAAAAAGLHRVGLRYGAALAPQPADLVVRVRGALGEETLEVLRLADGRLLGRQAHRDLEVFLSAASPLLGER